MLKTFKAKLPDAFIPYRPFPQGADREGWRKLPGQSIARLFARGEECLGAEIPQLKATDYLEYTREGNRTRYEAKFMLRRRTLCSLVLAECAEYEGRFVDDIVNLIWAIVEESGWQLPAHNTYVRDTPSHPLPDTSHPLLDLFACETGALLALTLYLLRDKLDAVSLLISERVERELTNRIIRPFLDDWFWWMGGRNQPTLNWTVWCAHNVLLTAFFMPLDESTRRAVAEKAMDSTDYFLDDYGTDGCCDEGASYFRRAGLCLFGILDLLDDVTGGVTSPVWAEEKVRNIGHYILNVHVEDRYYFNFADCSPFPGRAGVREYLYGKRCGDEALCDFAALEWSMVEDKDLPNEINLFNRAQALFTARQIEERSLPKTLEHGEIYYPSAGLFIARDGVYSLAVKAGDNFDNHNHNDTGSFTLYKNGQPFLIDVGVESYTRKTFSPQRYEIWTMQSSYHNLPDFDGVMQKDGEAYRATDVETAFGEERSSIAMRLERAWPKEAGLTGFRRSVKLNKGEGVVVEDVMQGGYRSAVLNLMFCVQPEIQGDTIVLHDLGAITVEGSIEMRVESIKIEDARLRQAWPDTLYRVRIGAGQRLVLTIR